MASRSAPKTEAKVISKGSEIWADAPQALTAKQSSDAEEFRKGLLSAAFRVMNVRTARDNQRSTVKNGFPQIVGNVKRLPVLCWHLRQC
jgi:hypothetical protein